MLIIGIREFTEIIKYGVFDPVRTILVQEISEKRATSSRKKANNGRIWLLYPISCSQVQRIAARFERNVESKYSPTRFGKW